VLWFVDAPDYGGAELYVLRVAAGLSVDAWVAATTPVPGRFRAGLVEHGIGERLLEVPPVRGKADLRAVARLVSTVRRVRPDLVHVNANATANARYGLVAALLARRGPVVLTVHTAVPVGSAVQRRVLGLLVRRCAAVVAVSDEVAAQVVGLGADRRRVHVVRNGVPIPPDVRRPARGAELRIGGLGRLTRQKGFDVLVEAVRLLVEDGVPARLAIGGDGPESTSLRRAATGLPVELAGEVTDVAAWWRGIDVFVLPSRWEGLPFVLLEAMAAGVPVVATDVGGVREATDGAVNVVPREDPRALADALRRLVDPDECARAGRQARERAVEALSDTAMLQATARVYASVGLPVSSTPACSRES
jgi:glycosyltransferase involved in cell wall biosynthesis